MYDLPAFAGKAAFSSQVWLPGFTFAAELSLGPHAGGRSDPSENEAGEGSGGSGVGDSLSDPSSANTGADGRYDRVGDVEGVANGNEDDPDLGITSGNGPGDEWANDAGPRAQPSA